MLAAHPSDGRSSASSLLDLPPLRGKAVVTHRDTQILLKSTNNPAAVPLEYLSLHVNHMKEFKTDGGGCRAFSLSSRGEISKTHSLPLCDVVDDAVRRANECGALLFMIYVRCVTIPYLIFLRVYQYLRRRVQ